MSVLLSGHYKVMGKTLITHYSKIMDERTLTISISYINYSRLPISRFQPMTSPSDHFRHQHQVYWGGLERTSESMVRMEQRRIA